jgi:hypothetical protein
VLLGVQGYGCPFTAAAAVVAATAAAMSYMPLHAYPFELASLSGLC